MAAYWQQLLYANVMACILIALVCALRRFGRRALGSRWLYACWLLVALRLLLPITLSVPMPEEIARPLGVLAPYVPAVSMEQPADVSVSAGAKTAPLPPSAVLITIWLAGAAATGSVMVLRNARFRKSLHMHRLTEAEDAALADCIAQYGLRLPRAYVSTHIHSPCIVGGLRPRLVIPQNMPRSDEAARFALLHEACHAHAGDTRWAWLRAALCCLHWFNPMVWLAARLSAIDAELACDMRVLAKLAEKDRFSYARTLVDAAQHQTHSTPGLGFSGGRLKARIEQILEVHKMKKTLMLAVTVLMVIVFGISFAVSEATQHDEYDWWIPAGIKEEAVFYRPLQDGASNHIQVKVSEMDDISEDSLIVTRIMPNSCKVVLNGEEGAMYREDLIIDPQTMAGKMGYIFSPEGSDLTIYEMPDFDGRPAIVLHGDFANVQIDEYGDDWCRIKLGQNIGYVPTRYLGVGFSESEDNFNWFYLE